MDLTVVTKPGPEGAPIVTDGLVDKHLTKKLSKIESRLGGRPLVARAVLEQLSVGYSATVTVLGGAELVGRARGPDLLKAVDKALDKLTRQIEARRDKRTGKERARRASSSNIKRAD
jgi:ribosome-associated translation inhibitor RaiA